MSNITIIEEAYFTHDLQKEMEEYARKKADDNCKVSKCLIIGGFKVTSIFSFNFEKEEKVIC